MEGSYPDPEMWGEGLAWIEQGSPSTNLDQSMEGEEDRVKTSWKGKRERQGGRGMRCCMREEKHCKGDTHAAFPGLTFTLRPRESQAGSGERQPTAAHRGKFLTSWKQWGEASKHQTLWTSPCLALCVSQSKPECSEPGLPVLDEY